MAETGDPFRATLDHLLEGFQIIDRDWTYLYVNPAAAAHGRTTPEALEGKKFWEVYPGVEASPLFSMLERAMNDGVRFATENLFTYPDGTTAWFELRIEPVPDGVCVHSIDIVARKRAEEALLRLNAELEERVAVRTRDLEAANRELEAFAYSVAHDLRAPLRAIDGFGYALVEDCSAQLDEDGLGYVSRMRGAAQRMSRLMDDLLALSRVGRAELRRDDVDVTAMAREIASELDEREPSRRVVWRIEEGLRAQCDRGLTRIVFQNLLENSWKFTARRPDAWVEVFEAPEQPGTFVVSDNGVGFDMTFAGELFKPFRRLHSEREFAGTGIGLATVNRVAERHGGGVTAKGAVGEGATVTVSFGHD